MTTSVKTVAVERPPITAMASGRSISAPCPMPSASGKSPPIAASVVMTIGRKRVLPATTSASSTLAPSARRRFATSMSKMPFFTTTPTKSNRPMNDETLMCVPVTNSPSATPISASGMAVRITSGNRNDRNVASITANTSATAMPMTLMNSANDCDCESACPPIVAE